MINTEMLKLKHIKAKILKIYHTSGFTLIEVLLALSILAIALTALLKSSADNINYTNRIKDKTIKHWVEMQIVNQIQMHEITLRTGLPTSKTVFAFGNTWYVQATLIPTALKKIYKIKISASSQQHGPYTDPLIAFYHEK